MNYDYQIIRLSDYSEEEYKSCLSIMPEERRRSVERYRFEADRKRTTAGELLARRMLSQRCGVRPEEITICRTERGKPYAKGMAVHFNVSHSGDLVLCAVSDSSIGADIERIRPVSDRLMQRVCNDAEYAYVTEDSISAEEKNRRFILLWTGKEAYSKYLGTGIVSVADADVLSKELQSGLTQFFYEGYAVSIFSDCDDPPTE